MKTFNISSDLIFKEMEDLFSDHSKLRGPSFFQEWIAQPLKLLIEDVLSKEVELKQSTVKKLASRYIATGQFETEEEKVVWKEIQWIFALCGVLISSKWIDSECDLEPLFLVNGMSSGPLYWTSSDKLLIEYPEFSDAPPNELRLLLKFRNMVHAAVQVIKPQGNKHLILYIASHLEGNGTRYITGSDMSVRVRRRVAIYEREGNVKAIPRLNRRKNPEASYASVSPDSSISLTSSRSNSLGSEPSLDCEDQERSIDFSTLHASKRGRYGTVSP